MCFFHGAAADCRGSRGRGCHRISLARSDDDIAMARYHTWQALSLETDAAAAAQLAVEA